LLSQEKGITKATELGTNYEIISRMPQTAPKTPKLVKSVGFFKFVVSMTKRWYTVKQKFDSVPFPGRITRT